MQTEVVPVQLGDKVINFQATIIGGEEDVGVFDKLSFREVTDAIEEIATVITSSLARITSSSESIKPHKASVEFGVEVAVESGALTALIVKGTGTANLKVTLEWGS